MPHTRSAKKRMRQNEKRRLYNRAAIRALKTQIKKVTAAAAGEDLETLTREARRAVKLLDKAAQRRIVHRNLAARKKAQISRLLRRREVAPPPAS
jgi:small subunit ribosomal protein S20